VACSQATTVLLPIAFSGAISLRTILKDVDSRLASFAFQFAPPQVKGRGVGLGLHAEGEKNSG